MQRLDRFMVTAEVAHSPGAYICCSSSSSRGGFGPEAEGAQMRKSVSRWAAGLGRNRL